jgi:hypothetical protein
MTIADLQKLKANNPSAEWEIVAPLLGMRADLGIDQLDPFTIPIAILPSSFHRELMKNASRWMDVYQEPPNHKREEARVRLLEAVRMSNFLYVRLLSSAQWYVPICSLFNGRLVDKPETPMPEKTSGGEVEHEVFLFDNLILLVIEMKFALKHTRDYYAQVLLELVCETFSFDGSYSMSDYTNQAALKLNRDVDLDPQPPIYAVLLDLREFYFLSYDGNNFRRMTEITIPHHPRAQFMKGMTQGMFPHCLGLPSSR